MATETDITKLDINVLTQAQYDAITTKNPNAFYLIPGDSITLTDEGTDPDWVGVKYRLVMIDGELFAEVVSV